MALQVPFGNDKTGVCFAKSSEAKIAKIPGIAQCLMIYPIFQTIPRIF
jgi:hypothetical protein